MPEVQIDIAKLMDEAGGYSPQAFQFIRDGLAHTAEHVHGNADIRAHERTFEAFVKFLAWNAVGAIVLLVFLALVNA